MSDALGKIGRDDHGHGPGSADPAHDHHDHRGHSHDPIASRPARRQRSRSLFLASAIDRLLLVIVVIAVLWLGVVWAIL